MNKEAQRIAIAKLCGKGHRQVRGIEALTLGVKSESYVQSSAAPDYLNDLNACYEFEKVATATHLLEAKYEGKLMEAVCEGPQRSTDNIVLIRATATQRAEAFLKTFNKWEEGE